MITKKELEFIMKQCTGTQYYYRSHLSYLTTDGVMIFAREAGAYWLLADINVYKDIAIKMNPQEDMFSVYLKVKGSEADLIFKDSKGTVRYARHYVATDCPEGEWLFYYFTEEKLLIWNGEY
jgi:hypothetical protein